MLELFEYSSVLLDVGVTFHVGVGAGLTTLAVRKLNTSRLSL